MSLENCMPHCVIYWTMIHLTVYVSLCFESGYPDVFFTLQHLFTFSCWKVVIWPFLCSWTTMNQCYLCMKKHLSEVFCFKWFQKLYLLFLFFKYQNLSYNVCLHDCWWSGPVLYLCLGKVLATVRRCYRKTSNIRRTLVDNKIVDHSDVVGASPVGAAPTTSSFST